MRIEIDYDFYKEIYHGDVIPEEKFDRMKIKAEALVNEMTFNRIRLYDLNEDDGDAVKMAICAAAESYHANEKKDGIQSEDNDGYKVTYDLSQNVKERVRAEARIFLSATDLMNRRVNYAYEC